MPMSHPAYGQNPQPAELRLNPVFTREPLSIPRNRLPER